MKIFFDTEFTGLHQKTTLISIGCVVETNQTFYAESIDYDLNQVDSWIYHNVIKNLIWERYPEYGNDLGGSIMLSEHVAFQQTTENIGVNFVGWLAALQKEHSVDTFEFWSDCLSYDWVLFCELFRGHEATYGKLFPDFVYYIPFDICTLFKMKDVDPDINREEFVGLEGAEALKHNSLWDSKVIRACYEKLITL